MSIRPNSKNVMIFRKNCKISSIDRIFHFGGHLEFTVEKISKLHIIYKKQAFIAIKTNFNHKNLKDIFMYENKTIKSFLFGSHLGCHTVSRLYYKLSTNHKVAF